MYLPPDGPLTLKKYIRKTQNIRVFDCDRRDEEQVDILSFDNNIS
jgi:hypothetical protein